MPNCKRATGVPRACRATPSRSPARPSASSDSAPSARRLRGCSKGLAARFSIQSASRSMPTMKKTAVLINVARGGIVKENDLIDALRARQIAGAAMDVFETEPLPPDSPLLGIDNLVVTPHLGAIASDVFAPTVRRMFDNIARVARGEAVPERDSVV